MTVIPYLLGGVLMWFLMMKRRARKALHFRNKRHDQRLRLEILPFAFIITLSLFFQIFLSLRDDF